MPKISLFFFLILIGCHSPQEKQPSQVLRMAITTDIETLDPREARSVAAQCVCKMLYDGLMRIDEGGKPIPSLAQVVAISPDKRTYTITLQESFWSNGDRVSACDFEYSWKSVLDPKNSFECASMLYCLKNGQAVHLGDLPLEAVGVQAVNDHTLVIKLEKPIPYFFELLAAPICLPTPQGREGGKLSNGPFKLEGIYPQDRLVLSKNSNYWDEANVFLSGITLQVVPDATTATLLFEQEKLDWIGSPLGELPLDYAQDAFIKGSLTTAPIAATLWYKCNTLIPPLNNQKLRQALSMAIDREQIVDHVLKQGQTPTASPLPPALSVSEENLPIKGDPEKAKRLFQEALSEMGLTQDTLPPITLTHTKTGKVSALTQALQQRWKTILGLNIQLEGTEFKTLLARMGRMDYQMGGAKIWIADYQDPANILSLYTTKEAPGQGGVNETGWENPKYQHLMERAGAEIDPEAKNRYYQAAEAILLDEMPIIPICNHTYCYQKRNFRGERIPPAGCPDFKWVKKI